MLTAVQGFKKQIRDISFEDPEDNDIVVMELKKLVESKNKEREKVYAENIRLTQLADEKGIKSKIEQVSQELRAQIAKNEEIEKKIEQMEELIGLSLNKSCGEFGGFTERKKEVDQEFVELGRAAVKPPIVKGVGIGNKLALAIEQAQKTLENSKNGVKRSASPSVSSKSLRYSTPPNIKRMNTSIASKD